MDIKQTFVLCNQNYYINKSPDEQFPSLNGTIISTSSSTTNNTYNTTNNINNYFYSNYNAPIKKTISQPITKVSQLNTINNTNANNNIVYSKSKIMRSNFSKKMKEHKEYGRSYSQNNVEKLNNNLSNNNYIHDNYFTKKEKAPILNVEELLMIDEKLNSVISCLIDNNPCTEECFECFDFYFKTKFSENLDNFFLNEKYLIIAKRSINVILFSLILCYDISLNENIFPQFNGYLQEIYNYTRKIFTLISKYFSNKITNDSVSNIWVQKLKHLITQNDPIPKTPTMIFEEINEICNILISNKYSIILKNYKAKIAIIDIYKQIEILSQDDIHKIYIDKIFHNMNLNGSIIASSTFFQENYPNKEIIPIPYLQYKTNKKFTLVLDLDETLIHFKENPNNESSGLLRFRPFLTEFLTHVEKEYELVIFTAAVQDYADPIIEAIEKKSNVIFDFRLYRKHTNIVNNDFVKDLSRLGRDLSRVIIVDNMSQNYKLQPNNGISIRPFWGKDTKDMVLVDLLYVLLDIAKNYLDVRMGINAHKEDIISKITSNIFRRTQI